ncbi:MAG: hypothetical protein HQM00_04455 [Magnetococcales bacterium]|nr:hypothetical protein [Magnetococcales bacterium]
MDKIWTADDFPECMPLELREEVARAYNENVTAAGQVTENSDEGWGWGLPKFPPAQVVAVTMNQEYSNEAGSHV